MGSKRVILKFGSGILTRTDRAEMDQVQLARLVEAIADLKSRGHAVVVMSSGAVSSGLKPLGFTERPEDIVTLQACAAVGQTHLMHGYESFLRSYGLHVAQLLLTHEDLENKDRAERVKATLERLLAFDNAVPVINENDSVAVEELRYGDDDKLSARVAGPLACRFAYPVDQRRRLAVPKRRWHGGTPAAGRGRGRCAPPSARGKRSALGRRHAQQTSRRARGRARRHRLRYRLWQASGADCGSGRRPGHRDAVSR